MKLVPIADLKPAAYNPRAADPERLAMVRLSLERLGWLLPVYATADGEILSGHQRTTVAAELGYDQVPVEIAPDLDPNTRRAVNIAFNRATNDMDPVTSPTDLAARLAAQDVAALAKGLPPRKKHYPCLAAAPVALAPILKANAGKWLPYALAIAKTLRAKGIAMPVILGPGGEVVNGIGRVQLAAEEGKASIPAVQLGAKEAGFARAMLNLISMEFSIHVHYADLLRFNSFRRARRTRQELGAGFTFATATRRGTVAQRFDIRNRADRERWLAEHGASVLDFGAGHLFETDLLRSVGVDCTPFEPYRLGMGNEIDKAASVDLTLDFLLAVASGKRWSSIFCSSVMNSVPFVQDRRHMVKIMAACAGPGTKVYALAMPADHGNVTGIKRAEVNERREQGINFMLNYEPNVILGEIGAKPKVQKYHTQAEFYELFKSAFERVKVGVNGNAEIWAVAARPLPLTGLKAALEFEFDLPYPDGSRMGLAQAAINAFHERHGVPPQ